MRLCVFGFGHVKSGMLERNGLIKGAVSYLSVKEMLANILTFY